MLEEGEVLECEGLVFSWLAIEGRKYSRARNRVVAGLPEEGEVLGYYHDDIWSEEELRIYR